MSVYREIPLSFGTLVLVHAGENPDAVHASWKVSPPPSLYQTPNYGHGDFAAFDGETEKDPLDLEMDNLESVDRSTAGQEMSAADVSESVPDKASVGRQLSEPHLSYLNTAFSARLSSLMSLWGDDAFDGTAPDIDINIGPTIRGTATAQKPHVCEVCGRPFRRRKDIRRHVSTHSNDKPFFCWICSLTFRSQEYLRRHLKRSHEPSYPSEDREPFGEPISGLPWTERRQNSAEEAHGAEQTMTEDSQTDGHGNESGFKIEIAEEQQYSLLQHHTAGDIASDFDVGDRFDANAEMRDIDVKAATEEACMKFQASVHKMLVPEQPNGVNSVPAPSNRCSAPQPKKAVSASLYLCDGCGSLMPHRNVMVLSNKQTASASKPCVLCKTCFIKKTGIICIG